MQAPHESPARLIVPTVTARVHRAPYSCQVTDTDWIAIGAVAAFTAAMAVAIIVTAVYAKRTLVATKDDSRARTRPVLVAYLERELLSHGTILLVVKNFGASSAVNVGLEFDPPAPPKAEVDALPDSDMKKWLYQRFAEPVPVWAPGWTTSNVIRAGQDTLEPVAVALSYEGPDGSSYTEHFFLHPDHILKETSSAPSKTDDPVKLGQQAVSAMQALVRTLRTR
jgi:hypothetical protein